MGRAFVDAVSGKNHLLVASTDFARGVAVLPNGDPLWVYGGGSATSIGSQLPSGFDGYTHDWEIGFWIRHTYANGNLPQNTYFAIDYPVTLAKPLLRISGYQPLGGSHLNITQYQSNGSSGYRGLYMTTSLAQSTLYFLSVTFPVGASPVPYLNAALTSTNSAFAPTGTPMPVDGSHRFILRPSDGNVGLSKGYLFKRILSASERSRLYASMLAA